VAEAPIYVQPKRQDGIEEPHHNNCRYQNQKRSIHMMTPFNQEMRNTDARKISQSFHWSSEVIQGFFTGNRKNSA
jgi:hypothetical protein